MSLWLWCVSGWLAGEVWGAWFTCKLSLSFEVS